MKDGFHDNLDNKLWSIKMKIIVFLGKNDHEVYLNSEKKVELIFDCHHYSKKKTIKLIVIDFTGYAII
jgi:uracil-DNA glycosylase